MRTAILLICSNTFMTIAWYGHLKFKTAPLFVAILLSWSIAFFEYCFQVPANRYGYNDGQDQAVSVEGDQASGMLKWWRATFSSPQLKIIQEAITITAFVLFNALYLKDAIRPTDWAAFLLIFLAVVVMMYPRWAEGSGQQPVDDKPQITQPANE